MFTKLKYKYHDLEEIHEKLSLIATKENEDEILEQIEIDFDCITSAIDIRIEIEVIEKETKFKIKDLETSAKLPFDNQKTRHTYFKS